MKVIYVPLANLLLFCFDHYSALSVHVVMSQSTTADVPNQVAESIPLPISSVDDLVPITLPLKVVTTANFLTRTPILKSTRLLELRRVFASIIVRRVLIQVHTVSLADPKGIQGPRPTGSLRFGLIPESMADVSSMAVSNSIPYMSQITLSAREQREKSHTTLPPGLELDLNARAVRQGHPVVVLINQGYYPYITGKAPDEVRADFPLLDGTATFFVHCSGFSFGVPVTF